MSVLIVKLEGDLSIFRASEIRDILAGSLEGMEEVKIDFGQVDSVDLSLLQLLISAQQVAEQNGTRLSLSIPLPLKIQDIIDRAGIYNRFIL